MIEFKLIEAPDHQAVPQAPFHEWTFPDGAPWARFFRTGHGYRVEFHELADFDVSANGLKVTCCLRPKVADHTADHLFLNQVLPLALSRQGHLVFHASAVALDHGAVAFVGASGRGKSTLAATFATNGFRFLTDDGLMVKPAANRAYTIAPSHPSIRLWEDSQNAVIGGSAQVAPALAYTTKLRLLAGDPIAFCDRVTAFRQVYFLGDGSARAPTIAPMRAADAVVEWVKHSFLLDVEDRVTLAAHFDQVSKLANDLPAYRLDYPRKYEGLASVRTAIIEHVRKTSSPDGFIEKEQ